MRNQLGRDSQALERNRQGKTKYLIWEKTFCIYPCGEIVGILFFGPEDLTSIVSAVLSPADI